MTTQTEHDLVVAVPTLLVAVGGWVAIWLSRRHQDRREDAASQRRAEEERVGIRREFYNALEAFSSEIASIRMNGFGDMARVHEAFAIVKERARVPAVLAVLPSDHSARLVQSLISQSTQSLHYYQTIGESESRRSIPTNLPLDGERAEIQFSNIIKPICDVLDVLFAELQIEAPRIVIAAAHNRFDERFKQYSEQMEREKAISLAALASNNGGPSPS
jgi:hypothetical protein